MDSLAAAGLSQTTAELVARRLGGPAASLVRARVAPIDHRVIRETTARLDRVTLDVRGAGDPAMRAYDVVVKRMRADSPETDPHRALYLPSDHPDHPNYWRREYDVYGAELFDAMPAPLRTPACYARELGPRTAAVWLECVSAPPAATWGIDRFAAAARSLAAWSVAAFDSTHAYPWLARRSLRMWAPQPDAPAFAALARAELWTTRAARDAFGSHARERFIALHEARDALLERLERGPQLLAHNDFWTRNILATARGDVVAIDWSELGIGPLAHDLVNLVLDSVWMFDVAPERTNDIERETLAAYVAGLGGDVRARDVSAAYRTNALLRFGALAGNLLAQAADDVKREEIGRRYGRSFEAVFDVRASVAARALAFFESVKT